MSSFFEKTANRLLGEGQPDVEEDQPIEGSDERLEEEETLLEQDVDNEEDEAEEEVAHDQSESDADVEYVEFIDIDGEEVELDEVLNAYKFNKANTQRAQEIAEQRKSLEQEQLKLRNTQQELAKLHNAYVKQLNSGNDAIDDQIMALEKELLSAEAEYDDDRVQDIETKISRLERRKSVQKREADKQLEELKNAQQAIAQDQIQRAAQNFIQNYPEVQNNLDGAWTTILKGAQAYGFTPEDVSSVPDHRVWSMFFKLGQVAEKPATEQVKDKKKSRVSRKVIKSGKQVTDQKAQQQSKDRSKLKQRAQKGDKSAQKQMFHSLAERLLDRGS